MPSLNIDRLVDRGHVAEGEELVKGQGGRRLQLTRARKVVHLRGKVGDGRDPVIFSLSPHTQT